MKPTWKVLVGDVREQLALLPDASVQCVVTSPPYWGLRDYGHAGQIGLEPTPDAFVQSLVEVFQCVWRVLKDDGVCWLNLGDSYAGSGPSGASYQSETTKRRADMQSDGAFRISKTLKDRGLTYAEKKPIPPAGLKSKDLVGIPWRVAFALQADGWYLRSDIIWSKPNPMPESVQDRPTKSHEYIFLLTKNERYFYDAVAIRQPYAPSTLTQFDQPYEGEGTKDYAGAGVKNPSDIKRRITDKQRGHSRRHAGFNDRWDAMPKDEQQLAGANCRSVWNIATRPYPDAHFATFPEAIPERCIKAGSRLGDTVLDTFTGSGTTGRVAIQLGRSFVGIELNPEYAALARTRIGNAAPLFAEAVS